MTKVQERGAVQIQPKSFDGVKTAQKGYAYLLKESKLDSASFGSSVKANGGVIKRLMKAVVGFGIGVGAFVLWRGKKKANLDKFKNILPEKKIQEIKDALAKGVKGKDDSDGRMGLAIPRPLRGRFNSAIDAFKYFKRTFYEKFLSRNELKEALKDTEKIIKELIKNGKQYKIINGKIVGPKPVEIIRSEDFSYVNQLLSDHKHGKQLLKMPIGM